MSEGGEKLRHSLTLLTQKSVSGFLKGFRIFLNYVLIIGVILITTLVALQAFLRYVLRSMPLGIEEGALIVGGWVYFIGIAVASRDKLHITVGILDRISPRVLTKIDLVGGFLRVGILGVFVYIVSIYCLKIYALGTTLPPFYWSPLVSITCLVVGLAIACLYEIAHLVGVWRMIRAKKG